MTDGGIRNLHRQLQLIDRAACRVVTIGVELFEVISRLRKTFKQYISLKRSSIRAGTAHVAERLRHSGYLCHPLASRSSTRRRSCDKKKGKPIMRPACPWLCETIDRRLLLPVDAEQLGAPFFRGGVQHFFGRLGNRWSFLKRLTSLSQPPFSPRSLPQVKSLEILAG